MKWINSTFDMKLIHHLVSLTWFPNISRYLLMLICWLLRSMQYHATIFQCDLLAWWQASNGPCEPGVKIRGSQIGFVIFIRPMGNVRFVSERCCRCIYWIRVATSTSQKYVAYPQPWLIIRTLHDCPSQMNENLLISNSKLTSDSELIWWR